MIRSTKTSLKFTNKSKLNDLNTFIDEYRRVISIFIDSLWELNKIPTLLPKDLTNNIDTWLSARVLQCAGKQASAIVRGTKTKENKTKFIIDKLNKEGKYKKARKLYSKINISSKPKISNIEPVLDSRFTKIDIHGDIYK